MHYFGKVYPSRTIVPTTVPYNSHILKSNILSLRKTYPFLNVFSIGTSILGNSIPCIQLGTGKKEVFYSAAMHANEWITSPLLMKFVEEFCITYVTDSNIFGYSSRDIFNSCSIYIAPMCNPDGVDLVTGLIPTNSPIYAKTQQIAANYPSLPFPSGWKATINRNRFKLTIPCWLGKCTKNKIFTRNYRPCST